MRATSFDLRESLAPLLAVLIHVGALAPAMAQPLPVTQLARHALEDTHDWSAFTAAPASPSSGQPVTAATWATLQQGGPWPPQDPSGLLPAQQQALQWAAAGRWDDVLALIRSQGVQPDFRDEQGRTLLTLAARQGQLSAVRGLLAQGAHPDRIGSQGRTPLGIAAWHGHELVVRELLFVGGDVNRVDARGQTPLHLAAQTAQLRVMALLKKAGADPLAMDAAGLTPLLHAAGMGRIDAMVGLRQWGVPLTQTDRQGLNAVHAAALAEQAQAVNWLLAQGVSVPGPLTQVLIDTMGRRVLVQR